MCIGMAEDCDITTLARFDTTHWSVVLTAVDPSHPDARKALATLCATYWRPLYAYVRRKGRSPADAQDVTQDFFTRLLEKDFFVDFTQRNCAFRTFLLTAMKNFLVDEWRRRQAVKRGGGEPLLSFEFDSEEGKGAFEPADERTAELLYDRQWAFTLLDKVLAALRAEYEATGKTLIFDRLKSCLTFAAAASSQKQLAAELTTTEGNVKVMTHRLRKRYRELLRHEIAQTVSSPAAVDDELRHLFAVLAT